MLRSIVALLLAIVAGAAGGQIAQTPVDGVDFFEGTVRPILERRCFKCHGRDPERFESGLVLTTRAGLLRGGDRGAAIDTRDPRRSLLLHAISYQDGQLDMPPTGRIPDLEVEAIRQWVELGAPYGGADDELTSVAPREGFQITEEHRAWWSHRPLRRPDPPSVVNRGWPTNGLDPFVLARLEAAGLAPAPIADRRTLIRRASYDLTGLPPTAEEVAAFEADQRPDAWERLLDRLLASPQYGIRWGRHWLDLVRFAETDGYERDRLKPGAWRYRDWVIDALNADMPYDQFLTHQLAGDEIDRPTAASIIATGYLRLGIWDDEPTDTKLAQYDDLDSILDTTSRVMLGVSMGCARCHNHRGDPVPQRDYYRMLSFFRGIAPYKVGGGNQPAAENYTDRIPEDLGSEAPVRALAEWRADREVLIEEARSLFHAAAEMVVEEALDAAMAERDAGLLAHLAFDQETLTVGDSVGGFDGRIEGAIQSPPGISGLAFRFDGTDDSIRIDRPVEDDFTISLWFRTTARARGAVDLRWFAGTGLVDGKVAGAASNDFGLSMVGDGYVAAGTGAPGTYLHSDPGYHDGEWHHVAFTRERVSGELRLFLDGEPEDKAVGSTESLDAPKHLDIGRLLSGRGHFEGDLDEVRIYDRALEHREVLDLYLARGGAGGGASAALIELVRANRPQDAEQLVSAVDSLLAQRKPRRRYLEVLRVKELGSQAPETFVLIRGNPHAPAAKVEPGFPEILDPRPASLPERGPADLTSGRRLTLARWIADKGNIRTSRVMANRLWQYHFGRGLVPTPNDFGRFGREPTHPELLDWLASELTARDWSLKSMHRLIMSSSAYRMSSRGRRGALAADPENNWLWRFDMRRLAAEEIRDSILAASGTLNLELGGPSIYPPLPEEVLATASRPDAAWGESTPEQAARRSIYIHVKRSLRHPFLAALDLADTDATCPVRFTTTQPTQALTMLNSDFMNQQAALLAQRVEREVAGGMKAREARVAHSLELVLARAPSEDEVRAGVELVRDLEREEGMSADAAFASYCLVLLNLNEFVYLD